VELSIAIPLTSAFLVQAFLLSLRLGAAFAASPLLAATALPRTVRALLVLGLAAALALALPMQPPRAALLDMPGALVLSALDELALGAALGLGIQLAMGAFTFAGRLLDVQMGFGLVRVFDPMSDTRGAVMTTALDQLGVLAFLLLNVHHVLLRGLAWSLERYPLGQGWPLAAAAAPLLKQVGAMFVLGLALAAPVVVCLLLVELALAVIAHALPQMNMLVIGFPVKIVVGMLALALWAPDMNGALARIYQSIYGSWNQILGAATPPAFAGEAC
jgi:flagellar biosynthetic protein FliR